VDTFVVPATAIEEDVAVLWKRILEFPKDLQMEMNRRNDIEFLLGNNKPSRSSQPMHVKVKVNLGNSNPVRWF
jgi:hypothetical protein